MKINHEKCITKPTQILYIHGFLSSEKSVKAMELANYFQQCNDVCFTAYTYPQREVNQSLVFIENWICNARKKGSVVLIGSSLGGFYAQYFGQQYQLPYCMINPALNPDLFYEHIGSYTNSHTGESINVSDSYIEELLKLTPENLKHNSSILLLMDQEDEVIDVDYAIQCYRPVKRTESLKVKVFSGGNHDFQHLKESFSLINDWLNSCQNA